MIWVVGFSFRGLDLGLSFQKEVGVEVSEFGVRVQVSGFRLRVENSGFIVKVWVSGFRFRAPCIRGDRGRSVRPESDTFINPNTATCTHPSELQIHGGIVPIKQECLVQI